MTNDLAPHYLTDAGGNFFYPLGSVGKEVEARTASGRTVEVRVAGSDGGPSALYERNNWYITRERVAAFVFARSPVKKIVQYRLKDETAASARFPLTLSPEEYNARREQEDPDYDDTSLTAIMYEYLVQEVPVEPDVVDVTSMTAMPGYADVHGSWGWEVERTAGLLYGPWYHHLLPGTLHGVTDRLLKALEERYGKREYFASRNGVDRDRQGEFTVTFNLPFDVPVFKTAPRFGRNGQKLKGTQQVQEFVPIRLEWKPGNKIQADTKSEAVAKYEKYEADTIEWIDSHRLEVCSHCRGNGYTKTSTPRPT